jgi:ubiquinone biosynthesis protein COQ9
MQEKREQILKEAIKIAPFEGWTRHTLYEATMAANLEKEYSRIAFPNGVRELVDLYLRNLDDKMIKKLNTKKFDGLKIREKIALAIRTRLEIAENEKSVIRKTVSYFANPCNHMQSVKSIWKTADSIWYAIGDTSTDFNYYTKRTILSSVYSSTLLYWLNDKSENHEATWKFLDRRIENVMTINKVKANFGNFFENFKFQNKKAS